jgi:protein involved in polysaccharide export with SLBB domain
MNNRIFRIVFFFFFFFSLSVSLFAQMTDQEVINEALKYNQSGLSSEQITRELLSRGATLAQLNLLQSQNANLEESSDSVVSNYDPMTDSERVVKTVTALPKNQTTIPSPNQVFGQDFFSAGNLTFQPSMNLPTPANYILGPGDEIIIDVWGNSELNLRYTITPDGYIAVPGLGRINLNGMRIDQATSRIRNEFSSIYADLDSPDPGTFLAISLGNLRSIQVNVMGEVVTPGTYTLSSFATAFHALYAAGGPNAIGSLRSIQVFRNGRIAATIDLYEYLIRGNNMNDITLQEGDIVRVNPYQALVQITGEVKRPMWYEMQNHETLNDLIDFAGGFKGEAFKNYVKVTRKGETDKQAYTVKSEQYPYFNLQDGDQVTVGDIIDKFSNMVVIDGAVHRPGEYAIGENIRTVRDLINVAQGTTGDAFLPRVLLYRELPDLTRSIRAIDLAALMDGKIDDIELEKNDRLFVSSVLDLESEPTVYIGGAVRKPGEYPYASNMSVEDIILQAGGVTEGASLSRIDIFRRIKDTKSITSTNTSSKSFTFSLDNGLVISDEALSFSLEPFDQVVVRMSPGYEIQQKVVVNGEVLFAGEYAKIRKDERISSLIQRAGGLTDEAYVKGARLTRKMNESEIARAKDALRAEVKLMGDSMSIDEMEMDTYYVGIDLEKALKKPGGDDDIILREGDVLHVPYYNSTVKISGAVMYPNTVTYNKRAKLSSYVRMAGGYSRLAMKNNSYVIYMNGQVAVGRHARIEPGCEIVVPEKPERQPISVQGILGIATSVTSIALLISNLLR